MILRLKLHAIDEQQDDAANHKRDTYRRRAVEQYFLDELVQHGPDYCRREKGDEYCRDEALSTEIARQIDQYPH